MSEINTKHTIYLKVLTPVHIGGAQEKHLQKGLDFLVIKDKTWRINWEKVYQKFDTDKIASAIISNSLNRLLENELEDVAFEMDKVFGTGEVKSFIRDGFGSAYISGSSIKGAMKNWLHSAYDTNPIGTRNLFGSFETDLFRFIKPSDCYMNDEVVMYPTKTFNLYKNGQDWKGGWKHSFRSNGNNPSTDSKFKEQGFVTDYECFEVGDLGSFSLSIQNNLNTTDLQRESIQAKFFKESPIRNLFKNISSQIQKHIEREFVFFNKYKDAEGINELIATIELLKQTSETIGENQCLLRLSAGSGFHGMTGDFQFQDHVNTGTWTTEDARKYKLSRRQQEDYVNRYIKFKSRKIAFNSNAMYPMGFVLLSTDPFE